VRSYFRLAPTVGDAIGIIMAREAGRIPIG
jgi:hypothetical protein